MLRGTGMGTTLNDDTTTTDSTKELKVKIPSEHHVKLQSLKVLAGKNISTAVTEAIAMYLEEHDGEPPESNGSNGSSAAEA